MKKAFLVFVLTLISASAYADPKVICEVAKGTYDNSILKLHSPVIIEAYGENGFDAFSMVKVQKLTINALGKDEIFSVRAYTSGKGIKIDLSLDSQPDQVRAVLLMENTRPNAGKKFDALLVITGTNIKFSENEAPLFGAESLVYNLTCKPMVQ